MAGHESKKQYPGLRLAQNLGTGKAIQGSNMEYFIYLLFYSLCFFNVLVYILVFVVYIF